MHTLGIYIRLLALDSVLLSMWMSQFVASFRNVTPNNFNHNFLFTPGNSGGDNLVDLFL